MSIIIRLVDDVIDTGNSFIIQQIYAHLILNVLMMEMLDKMTQKLVTKILNQKIKMMIAEVVQNPEGEGQHLHQSNY